MNRFAGSLADIGDALDLYASRTQLASQVGALPSEPPTLMEKLLDALTAPPATSACGSEGGAPAASADVVAAGLCSPNAAKVTNAAAAYGLLNPSQ